MVSWCVSVKLRRRCVVRRCTCCLSLCNGELVCVCKVEKEVCREEVYMLSVTV